MQPNPVGIVATPERVAAVLSPIRRRLLASLAQPDSASGLARRLGLPRQKINYHLRELERTGFVELAEERQRRGCVERCVRLTARAFVISPDLLGELETTPEELKDRFSSAYLVTAAARAARDVSVLRERAAKAGQKLATLALETEIGFASAADFKAFAEELTRAVARLAAKYQHSDMPSARRFRLMLASHPVITKRGERRSRK